RLTDDIAQFSRSAVGSLIFLIGDTSFPIATFGDGNLLTCTFTAKATAVAGTYPLTTTFLEVADLDGNSLVAGSADGSVVVTGGGGETPTPTPTMAPPTPTGIVVTSTGGDTAPGGSVTVTYAIGGTGASSNVASYFAQVSFDA